MDYPTIWPQFFTATIQNWKKLLREEEYKNIIIKVLKFLVKEKRIELNAFVLMDTHIHLIWQPIGNYSLTEIQRSFMTKTANDIKKKLTQENPKLLEELKVNKPDRTYQSR